MLSLYPFLRRGFAAAIMLLMIGTPLFITATGSAPASEMEQVPDCTEDATAPVPQGNYTRDWGQVEKTLGDNVAKDNGYGQSVAIDGNYAIVGAFKETDGGIRSGAAYIYVRSGDNWVRQAKLLASDRNSGDEFGYYVSIFGDYAIVGAYTKGNGAAYIFVRSGNSWTQQAKLVPSDGGRYFGHGVDLFENRAVIGAYNDGNSRGAAYVFVRNDTTWTEEAKLLASDGVAGDRFGFSVGISGNYIVAGGDRISGSRGAAYVFRYDGSSWQEQQKLIASDAAADDRLGFTVDIFEDYVIAGARAHADAGGKRTGAAYIWKRDGVSWNEQAILQPAGMADGDDFGMNVSIHDGSVVVGAHKTTTNGLRAGAAYVFSQQAGGWNLESKLLANDARTGDNLGRSVSVNRGRIIVGANSANVGGVSAGAAYFYHPEYVLPTLSTSTCSSAITATALDDCAGSIPGFTTDAVSFTVAGKYSINWSFDDGNGNTAKAIQEVTVTESTYSVPFFESVEPNSSSRDCWQSIDGTGDGSWVVDDNAQGVSGSTGAFYLPANGEVPGTDRLRSPIINMLGGTSYRLSFAVRTIGNVGSSNLRLTLLDATTGDPVRELFADTRLDNAYTTVTLTFEVSTNGSYRLAFANNSQPGALPTLLDNIFLLPNLPPPTNLKLVVGNDDDQCLSWTATGVAGVARHQIQFNPQNIFAEIDPNGNDLGDVTVELTDYASAPTAPFINDKLLGRYYNIVPENGSGPYTINGGVRVRLYFTDDELLDFNQITNGSVDWNDLVITHYDGVAEDCSVLNSTDNDFTTELPTATAPYGNLAHYIEFTTTTFSEFGATTAAAAPVTLTALSAHEHGPDNLLEWTVASEVDFSHYSVERSADGVTFHELGRVVGTRSDRYSLTDAAPAAQQYYRLRMVDLDGSYAYSKIVSVRRSSGAASFQLLEAYPVPTSDGVTLRFATPTAGKLELRVLDALGRPVRQQTIVASAGYNEQAVNLSGLPPATYQLSLLEGGTVHTLRVVKR